jgi:gas vesicle protein
MTSTSKIILGVVGAVAAGIAIGMLMAPEKGANIRQKLSDTVSDLADNVSELIATGKEKISEIAGNVTKQADTVATQANGLASDAVKRATTVKESVG